jgi:hypothetical protein
MGSSRRSHARLSAQSKTANAIEHLLKRWPAFTRFLDDGRICLSNNAAKRALRGIAVGRHNWTFAGSDEGGRRAAAMYNPDRDGEGERDRSPRLARRCSRPPSRSPPQATSTSCCRGLGQDGPARRRRLAAHAYPVPSTHLSRGTRRMRTQPLVARAHR